MMALSHRIGHQKYNLWKKTVHHIHDPSLTDHPSRFIRFVVHHSLVIVSPPNRKICPKWEAFQLDSSHHTEAAKQQGNVELQDLRMSAWSNTSDFSLQCQLLSVASASWNRQLSGCMLHKMQRIIEIPGCFPVLKLRQCPPARSCPNQHRCVSKWPA